MCELCRGQVVEINAHGLIAPIKCASRLLYHHLSSNIMRQLPVVDNAEET